MYELTCPSCKHTIRLPFVRPGAVAACAGCRRPFPVKADYFKRVPVETGADGSDALLPSVNRAAATANPPGGAPATIPEAGVGSATMVASAPASTKTPPMRSGVRPGVSANAGAGAAAGAPPSAAGVNSNAAAVSPDSTPARGIPPSLSPPTPPSPFKASSGAAPAATGDRPLTPGQAASAALRGAPNTITLTDANRGGEAGGSRSRVVLLLLLALLILLTMTVGIVAFMLFHESDASTPQPTGATPPKPPTEPVAKPPVPGPSLLAEPDIPLGRPEAIPPMRWSETEAGRKFTPPKERDEAITLDELRPVTVGRSLLYSARVVVNGPELYESATVEFTVLDKNGDTLGVATVKAPMVSGRLRQVEATIPSAVQPKVARVEWTVKAGSLVRSPTKFDDIVIEKWTGTPASGVKLTTFNPSDKPLRRCLFLLRGFDDRGAVNGEWLVSLEKTIDPAKRIEVAVVLPKDAAGSISNFTAIGVGVVETTPGR